MKINHNGSRPVSVHSVVIQSSLLKVVLQQIFDHYPEVAAELDDLVFEAPFRCFFHRWDRLEAYLKDTECQTTHEHLLLLHNIIQEELKEAVARYQDLTFHRLMRFNDLWMIFNPDVVVFLTSAKKQGDRLGKLKSTSYQKKDGQWVFKLRLLGVAWDGDDIGYTRLSLSIPEYDGATPVRDLKAYPLNYHQCQNELCERLIARGQKYQGLARVRLVTCKGLAFGRKESFFDRESNFTEDGRVVIDARSFGRQHPNDQIEIIPLDSESTTTGAAYWDCGDSTSDTSGNYLPQQAKQESPRQKGLSNQTRASAFRKRNCFCVFRLSGAMYYVEDVHDISWNDRAIASLVLPRDYKSLILAFVESQASQKQDFDDVIAGKGQGVIMLFAGPPGTGKTLTAESVAERLRVPLYSMSACELGITASSVESKLATIFDLVVDWNAVLLIDEADVFLESRNTEDLGRNQLVSIFLRTLEYYKGVLFLTTNRASTIDEAFKSRFHLTINYPQLDATARKAIWHNLVDISNDGHGLTDTHLTSLAQEELNGRQIKNTVKTARLLARTDNKPLAEEHIRTVLRVMKENVLRSEGEGVAATPTNIRETT